MDTNAPSATAPKMSKKKRVTIALSVVISLVLALTIFLCVMCDTFVLGVDKGSTDHAYGTVFADIDGITTANPRIVDIAMLGSHDTGTDQINKDSPVEDGTSGGVNIANAIAKGFSLRFAVTQTVGVGEQLLQGARYLQFKYSWTHGDWYSTHTFLSDKFEVYVTEVLHFLDTHPGEFVILALLPCKLDDGHGLTAFHDWLDGVKYNGKNIYDYIHYGDVDIDFDGRGKSLASLRYNDVTAGGTKAGVVMVETFENLDTEDSDRELNIRETHSKDVSDAHLRSFYPMDSFFTHWANRNSPKAQIENMNVTCARVENDTVYGYKDCFKVHQTQAAIGFNGPEDGFYDIFGWSLLKLAEKQNMRVLEHENFDYWIAQMPILMVDYLNSDTGDFNARVNAKLRAINQKMVSDMVAQ